MRCISRITKALHSEAADLIRGVDVLLEMQKVFLICPPENLREDLPSLADFDFVSIRDYPGTAMKKFAPDGVITI